MGVMGKPLRSPTPKALVTQHPTNPDLLRLIFNMLQEQSFKATVFHYLLFRHFLRRHPVGVPLSEMSFALASNLPMGGNSPPPAKPAPPLWGDCLGAFGVNSVDTSATQTPSGMRLNIQFGNQFVRRRRAIPCLKPNASSAVNAPCGRAPNPDLSYIILPQKGINNIFIHLREYFSKSYCKMCFNML